MLECWQRIRKNAAYGVDRVSAEEYGKNLTGNIRQLVERLKRKSYRARLVRRHYIPKGWQDASAGDTGGGGQAAAAGGTSRYWKPSTSRISCDAVTGIVRRVAL